MFIKDEKINKFNTNNNSTKLKLGILTISVITILMISSSVIQYAYATDAPVIISLVADDPDDLDEIYSDGDTITIKFNSDTNKPGGTGIQRISSINDLFTFSESIGQRYRGQWTAADTFTITINSVNNAALVIGVTTVTPDGTTPILSSDETSVPSSATSPVLIGDFGEIISILDWILGAFNTIYYSAGNVGIGTDNPTEQLQVDGNFKLNGNLTSDGDICIGRCQ